MRCHLRRTGHDAFLFTWACVGQKKPGFTERIMTVMVSKSFIIALLDNHSRVGVGLPTLEDRAHIVFVLSLCFLLIICDLACA
jgi:hypothetical protein